MANPKDNTIRFRAKPRMISRLRRVAKLKDMNHSEIVRNAVSEYIEREERKQSVPA